MSELESREAKPKQEHCPHDHPLAEITRNLAEAVSDNSLKFDTTYPQGRLTRRAETAKLEAVLGEGAEGQPIHFETTVTPNGLVKPVLSLEVPSYTEDIAEDIRIRGKKTFFVLGDNGGVKRIIQFGSTKQTYDRTPAYKPYGDSSSQLRALLRVTDNNYWHSPYYEYFVKRELDPNETVDFYSYLTSPNTETHLLESLLELSRKDKKEIKEKQKNVISQAEVKKEANKTQHQIAQKRRDAQSNPDLLRRIIR